MRVVAGKLKGRSLDSPEGDQIRPTSNRVKEAMFNALYSLDAIEGARFLIYLQGLGH